MHPLLRNLRTDLSLLKSSGGGKKANNKCLVTDSNPNLASFCKTLEEAFQHGLQSSNKDFFCVMQAIAREKRRDHGLNALIRHVVQEIDKCASIKSNEGRGRYFLRYCLHNGWLSSLVMSLRGWKDAGHWYDVNEALLLRSPKDSLMEIFPMLDLVRFDLHLANRSFLDTTWELPVYRRYEVPACADLGLMVCSVRGRIIVTKVKALSAAGQDNKVCVGDVIDDLDGQSTFEMLPEHLAALVRRCDGARPLALSVIKAEKEGRVFAPLASILAETGLNITSLEESWAARKRWREPPDIVVLSPDDGEGSLKADGDGEFNPLLEDEDDEELTAMHSDTNNMLYIGSLKVGAIGDSSLLDRAIQRVNEDQKKVHHSVSLQLRELGVRMICTETGNVILDHMYPEISACGCFSADNHYLAFIAGNDLCTVATDFLCHVFYCSNQATARDIILRLAAGFDRTQDTV